MTRVVVWVVVFLAVLIGVVYWYHGTLVPSPAGGTTGLANPASVHCADIGGQLEIVNGPSGAIGICHTKDGQACEEWALFRDGTCVNPEQ